MEMKESKLTRMKGDENQQCYQQMHDTLFRW